MERFDNLPQRLRDTTEKMANACSVDMGLWVVHSNTVLDAALKIEALERELEGFKYDQLRSIWARLYLRWRNRTREPYTRQR